MGFLLLTPFLYLLLLALASFFALVSPFLIELVVDHVCLELFLRRFLFKIGFLFDNDASFISIDAFLLPS